MPLLFYMSKCPFCSHAVDASVDDQRVREKMEKVGS